MGTRHLTAVHVDGEYKIAQYGQWDGYPEGQGITALRFARTIATAEARATFAEKVRKCHWITQEECDHRNAKIQSGEVPNWQKVWPELHRDTGAEILELVMKSPDGLALRNDINFAADSLFCEWAWVIDLDAGTFEGYKGFNENTPLTEEDRFYFLRDKEDPGYHGVRLVGKWNLDALPTGEDFLAAFKKDEEE